MEHSILQYHHFGCCLYITNGVLELVVPLDFGIRVLRFACVGGENLFYELPEGAAFLTQGEWRHYGGHRVWLAPETPKACWPDNSPVEYELLQDGVRLKQAKDGYLPIAKELELRFASKNTVSAKHVIYNKGDKPITGAAWGISAVRLGGRLQVPFYGEAGGYAPQRMLSLWGDTRLDDPRLQFEKDAVVCHGMPVEGYFKMGLLAKERIIRYETEAYRYTKRFDGDAQLPYPDGNVNVEIFMCPHMLEIESLSPLAACMPEESVTHMEYWGLEANK